MISELLTVYGTASPTAGGQSGTFTLRSQQVRGTFTYIRLPKGLKAKLWAKRLAGTAGFTLLVEVTDDVTAATPTWVAVDAEHLSAAGSLQLEKRRPVVVVAKTGKEAVRFGYANTTGAGTIYIAVDVEITSEE